jgi:signal transduction histidine kinase
MKHYLSRSFFFRISVVLFLVLSLVALSYVALTSYLARNYYLETTQRLNRDIAHHLIHEVSPFVDGKVNEEALGTIMHSMMAVNPTIEVYLVDAQGEMLSYVVLDKKVKLKAIDVAPITRALAADQNTLILGDDPRNPGKEVVFSAAPVLDGDNLQGYVYIVLESEEQELITTSLLGSYFIRAGFLTFLVTLIVAFGLGLGLIYFLTRGLRKIYAGLEAFENGDYSKRIEVTGNDELARLAMCINDMGEKILQNIDEIKKVDVLRRELIANVSHDLRSPIAVIHGYVETYMMKQHSIDEAEKKIYLEAIIHNTEKLNKMVNDLFDLSKLEAKQITPQKEPVLMHEVLLELCQQSTLLAEKRNIRFRSLIPEKQLPVSVDIQLVNRAIQNVIDNAIKYADDGGEVTVSAKMEAGNYLISVENTGDGIDAKDLPFIFERYYKGSKVGSVQSTGLGLTIAQKIVALHGGIISVESTKKLKTAFVISLPC